VIPTLAAVFTATPTPTPVPDGTDDVGPGVWGFVVTAFVAVLVILLIVDMVRRMRRVRYREEVAAQLDAEQAAAGDDAEDESPAS